VRIMINKHIQRRQAMKQNDLVKAMYKASLAKDFKKLQELRKAELKHITEKRAEGKSTFSPKWIVTDQA